MIAVHVALIADCVLEPLLGHRTFVPALGWTMLAVAVIVEGFALPLSGSAWITACAFTVLNAALLTVRIRRETSALAVAAPSDTVTAVSETTA